jgi:hypothetical protein
MATGSRTTHLDRRASQLSAVCAGIHPEIPAQHPHKITVRGCGTRQYLSPGE